MRTEKAGNLDVEKPPRRLLLAHMACSDLLGVVWIFGHDLRKVCLEPVPVIARSLVSALCYLPILESVGFKMPGEKTY